MAKKPWENREHLKARLRLSGMAAHICLLLGIVFAIIGVVAAALRSYIGLGTTTWLLLAIATLVVSVTMFFVMGLAWYLITTDAKKKE